MNDIKGLFDALVFVLFFLMIETIYTLSHSPTNISDSAPALAEQSIFVLLLYDDNFYLFLCY